MRDNSHPLIIGTKFMCKNNVVLDFCSKYFGTRTQKVKCKQRVIIQQNSECIVQGILPKHTVIGLQGVCARSVSLILDIFDTKENPSLGFTSLVENTIHLQPNAVSKHHKPYRLSPDKREVLGTQLTELLNQGIITPVNEIEDIPIYGPIVLVS